MNAEVRKAACIAALALVLGAPAGWGAVRGRALLVDSPSRSKPGDLVLCTLCPGKEPPKLVIVKATYGLLASNQTADVTEKVKGLIKPEGLLAVVNRANFGDPAPGKRKELKIEYTIDGRSKEQTVADGGTVAVDFTRKLETLVEGPVTDAHFSPDGKQAVYGVDGMIKIMVLETRAIRDICPCTTNMTYFNWTADNKIHWSDGPGMREIYAVDIATKEKKLVHKGNAGRSTVSSDGKRAAWVMPPACAVIGGKNWRYMGGCGGSVSPSGKYLTSNLTTTHKLMGIFTFDDSGPSEKPIATAVGVCGSINGFSFGRTDEWTCYTVEAPENVAPTAYICYWRTDDHVEIAKHYVIKDFFDETDVLPADAVLERIAVCCEGPTLQPLQIEYIHVGMSRPLKVVGYYKARNGEFTPQLRDGVTWKADGAKVALSVEAFKGLALADRVNAVAQYKGKTASFDVTVFPELTGDGFKAEFFGDDRFATNVLTRVDRYIDFRWQGSESPDRAVDGRRPWSARWTGMLEVPQEGAYTFSFQLGEGNEGTIKREGGEKIPRIAVWVDGAPLVLTKTGGYPWTQPRAGQPVSLKKGRVPIKMETIDTSAHPVVARLFWSGPGIKQSLLGGGYVHSGAAAAGRSAPGK